MDSDGQTRFKWMEAGRKELDNLKNTGTVEPISPERKYQIKVEFTKQGLKYVLKESLPLGQTNLWLVATRQQKHMARCPPQTWIQP